VSRRREPTSKRVFDLFVASALLIATAPLAAVAAALVKATSRGPVLYRASRAGRDGQEFAMLKFRTMRTGLDAVDRRVTAPDDDRVTPVGALLRRTKLDELPQLINVLRGDMSVVGPRPEDIEIVRRHYTDRQRRTLEVRPGIASSAELRWYPDLTHHDPPPPGMPMQEWYISRHLPAELEESLTYLERRNLLLDLSIVARLAWNTVRYAFGEPPRQPFTPVAAPDHDPEPPLDDPEPPPEPS
jgi:lipopolysaccharide/colanic/teichoic acid biosynthesis glycosyltransferase